VSEPPPPSSSRSHEEDDNPVDSLFDGCLTTAVEATLVGAFHGAKWLLYDWWANPEPAEPVVFEDPSDPASSNYIPALESNSLSRTESHAIPAAELQSRQPDEGNGSVEAQETPPDSRIPPEEDFMEPWSDAQGSGGHTPGSPVAPYLRIDYRWQYLESDLDANDYLLEAGYSIFALYGRVTQYEDHAADENLDIEQYYGLIRLGETDSFHFPGGFQIGLGAGAYLIEGNDDQGGPALTLPVLFYPSDWFGLEFRPAWASINRRTISDYDISISTGYRFIQLRAGYRWLWVQHEGHWLDGPYAGVSLGF
jgi:hypothetical protein